MIEGVGGAGKGGSWMNTMGIFWLGVMILAVLNAVRALFVKKL